jgi:hypothetical protein
VAAPSTVLLDAAAAAKQVDAAVRLLPPEWRGNVPSIDVNDLNQLAVSAGQFLDAPVEATTSIASQYLHQTIGDATNALEGQIKETISESLGVAVGAAAGTVVPILGNVVGAAVGLLVTETVNDLAVFFRKPANSDAYADVNGARIPEVEAVLAEWARPELRDAVSRDLHNVDPAARLGSLVLWGGARWNIPSAYWNGALTWAKLEYLARIPGGAELVARGETTSAALDGAFRADLIAGANQGEIRRRQDQRLSVARAVGDELDRQLAVALKKFVSRRANEAQAKAMVLHRVLLLATAPPQTNADRLRERLGVGTIRASITGGVRVATLADYVAFYLGGGTLGRVPPPPPDIAVAAAAPVAARPGTSAGVSTSAGGFASRVKFR